MVRITVFSVLVACVFPLSLLAQVPSADQLEYFEQHIRPVLVEKCYKCHNSIDNDEAGLALDFRDGIRAETEHGAVVVPGSPAASVLMQVIRHEIDGVEMPEDGGKLDDDIIARFETWIKMGAPDPRDAPPSEEELAAATSWQTTLANRKKWWSLQPVVAPPPPAMNGVDHPIDRFVRHKLRESDLQPAERADRRTLIRRLSNVLTGLPPTSAQVQAFLSDNREDAYERLVDDMLASERFGERWARHWMDLMRYADSHGSEGDPAIPDIYRYRDYLIRAFNQDIPYDQLLREHVAGDLLEQPRINKELGINESLIGPAHWRLVFHGFAPTDALDEKVRFTDDQINVFSKAFLGLTVSCARCHDHKFDAISQADYYALFGILASCRPTLHDVNLPDKQVQHVPELEALKTKIRTSVAQDWLDQLDAVESRLDGTTDEWKQKLASHEKPSQLFYVLSEFKKLTDKQETGADAWAKLTADWKQHRTRLVEDRQQKNARRWNLRNADDYESWLRDGNGLPNSPSTAGEFRVESAERVIGSILPAGVHANTVSTKHRAFLASPRFMLDQEYKAWLRISGGGRAMTRYAVENYPRDGTVYPIRDINNNRWYWQEYNLKYWQGDNIHLEINTARDAPLRTRGDERSWFSIREVIVRNAASPKPVDDAREFADPLFAGELQPQSTEDVVAIYVEAIRKAVSAWQANNLTDTQAVLLNECLVEGLLNNNASQLPNAEKTVDAYLKLEERVPVPTRVPGLMEAEAADHPIFVRGNHRKPADTVPRRFLEAINSTPFDTRQSGRLELANNLVDPANPLPSRVMANRIWHYVFGQGIVPTTDNFGQLGQRPSHPELLDFLANRFASDWSIKSVVRLLVTSDTFQQQSTASEPAIEADPANRLLSHANVRRLDAESIRDTLMAVSGGIQHEMYGPGFAPNSEVPRRAVYIRNRRNSLDKFLEAFNAPVPFATTGRRSETNVPAQSLAMLNSPFVMQIARAWAKRQLAAEHDTSANITTMFEAAIGRIPSDTESRAIEEYLESLKRQADSISKAETAIRKDTARIETELNEKLHPIRERLLAAKSNGATLPSLAPLAAWDFSNDLTDSIGDIHGSAKHAAKVEDDALVLSGGFVATAPIQQEIGAKTLVATVQLDNLDQQGGGVITLQTLDGGVFDSVVFGERQKGHWMAGSNGFARTEDFHGPREQEGQNQPIHIAIAYDDDGTIRGYRNGEPYGTPIRKSNLQTFAKGKSQVLFGLRHGDGGAGRILQGKVFDAQLYDRALTSGEIAALAQGKAYVSDKEVLAQLPEQDRQAVADLRSDLADLKRQWKELGQPINEQEQWARIAHALFNLKEFIYLK